MLNTRLLYWHIVPVMVFTLGWAAVNPTRSAVLIDENFSTDVIASGDWLAMDGSVVVDTANGWLRIGANGTHNGGATKQGSYQLPLVIEWRMRTLDGQGEYFSLPKLEFAWGAGIGDRYHVTYVQDDQSGNPSDDGWLFGSWSNLHTLGTTGWTEWRTVRVIIRGDGGELFVKQDGDLGFTPIVARSWVIPTVVQEFRLSQHSDDVSEFDYITVRSLDDSQPFCDSFEDGPAFSARWQTESGAQSVVGNPTHSGGGALSFTGDAVTHRAWMYRTGFAAAQGTYSAWVQLQGQGQEYGAYLYFQMQGPTGVYPGHLMGYGIACDTAPDVPGFRILRANGGGEPTTLGSLPVVFGHGSWINIWGRRFEGDSLIAGYEWNGTRDSVMIHDPNPVFGTGRFYVFVSEPSDDPGDILDDICFDSSLSGCQPGELGAVAGRVVAGCGDLEDAASGVRLDAFDESGHLTGTAVSDTSGDFVMEGLIAGQSYTLSVVMPLGYTTESEEINLTIACRGLIQAEFHLLCSDPIGEPRTIGFWKHQLGVATGGKGSALMDAGTLCGHLDLIAEHFNSNAINQVIVYEPPLSDECSAKLLVAKELLNLRGSSSMTARARQQLTATLLNVAAGYLHLASIVSADGATLSQAVTHADQLIDDPAGDHESAKTICDLINNGQIVPSGVIPMLTADISYKTAVLPKSFNLGQNHPNPFNAGTVIPIKLESDSRVRLDILDVLGRQVATLLNQYEAAGTHNIAWNGRDDRGQGVATGVYFYRLTIDDQAVTRKMLLIK